MNENEDFLEEEILLEDENSNDEENSGLFEHLNITVDKKQEPLRIDKFYLFIVKILLEIKIRKPGEQEKVL